MTGPEAQVASATASSMVDNAQRLGLTWALRPATVETDSPLTVTFDGDTVAVDAVSTIGILRVGMRVTGLLIPPGGAFIIGVADASFTNPLGITVNLNQAGGTGNTTSATFVDMPGSPTLTFVKKYPAALTHVKATMSTGAFSGSVNTGVAFALLIDSSDRVMMGVLINVANAHVYFSSTILLTGLAAGTYSVVGRWRRVSGAGLLQTDGSDWTSITLDEVWAI